MTKTLIIGVDGGGTGCRAAVGTVKDGVLAEGDAGPANVTTDFNAARENIVAAVTKAMAHANLPIDQLSEATAHVGVAGILGPQDCITLAAVLPFGKTTVSSDRHTAVAGALGDTKGGLLSIGTGCIVAVQSDTATTFNNGWGFVLSDQGSGAWLGKRALEKVLKCHDGMYPFTPLTSSLFQLYDNDPAKLVRFAFDAQPADFAEHAPLVMSHAASDAVAAGFMQDGADHLIKALEAIGYWRGQPLCLMGGVGPHYAPFLPKTVQSGIIDPKGSALDGAFALAKAATT